MMCVVGSRLWPATAELAFMFCHIVRQNTVGVTQKGNLLGNCPMTNCYCELWRIVGNILLKVAMSPLQQSYCLITEMGADYHAEVLTIIQNTDYHTIS